MLSLISLDNEFVYRVNVLANGDKYFIDVTSARFHEINRPSRREREVAEIAKKYGFRVLQPVIYFVRIGMWKLR